MRTKLSQHSWVQLKERQEVIMFACAFRSLYLKKKNPFNYIILINCHPFPQAAPPTFTMFRENCTNSDVCLTYFKVLPQDLLHCLHSSDFAQPKNRLSLDRPYVVFILMQFVILTNLVGKFIPLITSGNGENVFLYQ